MMLDEFTQAKVSGYSCIFVLSGSFEVVDRTPHLFTQDDDQHFLQTAYETALLPPYGQVTNKTQNNALEHLSNQLHALACKLQDVSNMKRVDDLADTAYKVCPPALNYA